MKPLVEVTGIKDVLASLQGESLKGKKKVTGRVGFSAYYAVYVHEDLTKHHPVGQAKFLETAARRYAPAIRRLFGEQLALRKGVVRAMEVACEELRLRAVQITPIDTGFLRESAFVEVSEG